MKNILDGLTGVSMVDWWIRIVAPLNLLSLTFVFLTGILIHENNESVDLHSCRFDLYH